MEISVVTEVPKPLFLLACGDVDINLPRNGWLETLRSMSDLSSLSFEELVDSQYRSVTLGRLERVLNAGIDVEPPTAVFSTDSWDKALEYGGWPKLLLVQNQNLLVHTPCESPLTRRPNDARTDGGVRFPIQCDPAPYWTGGVGAP